MKTKQLVKLVRANDSYPFTLLELKDLFSSYGDINTQVEDLLSQNQSRLSLLEQFRALLPEMRAIQDRLGLLYRGWTCHPRQSSQPGN